VTAERPARPDVLTVGVWLEVLPDTRDLRGEGIARTLGALLRELTARPGARAVVAVAGWTEPDLRLLLEDWRIPEDGVEVLVSRARLPLLLRLRRRPPGGTRWRDRLAALARGGLAARPTRWALLRLAGVASVPVAILVALLAAPLALLAAVLLGLPALALAAAARLARRGRRSLLARAERLGRWARQLEALLRDALFENEFRLLARRANRRRDIDVWLVTYPGAIHPLALTAPLVVAVPDVVYADFPTLFTADWVERVDRQIRRLVPRATAVISYSRYVAARHVVGYLGVKPERAHVIPHAPFDAGAALDAARGAPGQDRRQVARAVVRDYLAGRVERRPGAVPGRLAYVRDLPFDEVDYLFVSARLRPTKGYLNLLRAFERLVRRRYRSLKLVTTAAPEDGTDGGAVHRYLSESRLDLDVLSIPDLPSSAHAAFLHLAALTVVPTLFEGGFPFPFSESLPVDTPVVMSAIPVTREVVPPDLWPAMLFDPYDVDSIAGRIEWALDHRRELLDLQRPLHASLRHRTWAHVADEYLAVLRAAARGGGQPR
jgi:glycosyltransferase involved in cell wall biosynthesis